MWLEIRCSSKSIDKHTAPNFKSVFKMACCVLLELCNGVPIKIFCLDSPNGTDGCYASKVNYGYGVVGKSLVFNKPDIDTF